jgi:nitrogen fixation protein
MEVSMKFEVIDPIPLSVDEAFLLLRDQMTALVPFMEDTEEIVVVEREELEGQVKMTNRWRASRDKIPSAVRSFIKPETLSWHDHATWTTADHTGRWELDTLGSDKLFSCRGETSLYEEGSQTYLKIAIEFEVYPERVPGLPKFLAKKIGGQVEKMIGELLSSNMKQMAQSMTAYASSK